MTDNLDPNSPQFDDLLAFTPVPTLRKRANGWTAQRQRRFITALSLMGAVGMGRASAYRLRERAGAESFAEAWDIAIQMGDDRQFEAALDLAINGVTTIRVVRGGMVDISYGPDRKLLRAAICSQTGAFSGVGAGKAAGNATRETL